MVNKTSNLKVGFFIRTTLFTLIISTSCYALRNIPVRIEGAYFPFDNSITLKGMIDIKRTLAIRLCLAGLKISPDIELNLGIPGVIGSSVVNNLDVVYSPWRGKMKIQPYCFGGCGFTYSKLTDNLRGRITESTEINLSIGVGLDSLLFFFPKIPALFLENRLLFSGSQIFTRGLTSVTNRPSLLPELQLETTLGIGFRL